MYNENPVNANDIEWADIIFTMENEQRNELSRRFPKQYLRKKILCLNIPDVYNFYNPELIKLLNIKMNEIFIPAIQ